MMILPLPPMRIDERLGHRGAHELVVGREKAMDVDLSSGAISVSMSMTGMPASIIFLTGCGQRADAERLDGDEIPFLRGHVVDGGALLDGVELAVEPGHLDIEQLAPLFGRLLALGAPGGLQPGVGEGGLQRLLRTPHRGPLRAPDRWLRRRNGRRRARGGCRLKEIAPGR